MVETTAKLSSPYWDDNSDDPEIIRARIEQTRANMSQTVTELQAKLSPDRLTQEATEKIKDATLRKVETMTNMATNKANNWRAQAVETVRQNPIPAAMIGIGLGWLLFGSNRSSANQAYAYPQRYYGPSPNYAPSERFLDKAQAAISENVSTLQDKAGEMAQDVQGKMGEMAGNLQAKTQQVTQNVQEKVGQVAGNIQNTASEVAGNIQTRAGEISSNVQGMVGEQADYLAYQAQHQADLARRGFQDTLEENPLAIGAVAIVAGAAIGLMLPITQKENELMGATRDRLWQQAQDTAQETFKKVEQVAGEVYQAATETAKDKINEQKIPSFTTPSRS